MRKTVSNAMLFLLAANTLALAFIIQPVKADELFTLMRGERGE